MTNIHSSIDLYHHFSKTYSVNLQGSLLNVLNNNSKHASSFIRDTGKGN